MHWVTNLVSIAQLQLPLDLIAVKPCEDGPEWQWQALAVENLQWGAKLTQYKHKRPMACNDELVNPLLLCKLDLWCHHSIAYCLRPCQIVVHMHVLVLQTLPGYAY